MIAKVAIILGLLLIIYCLGSGLYFLVIDKSDSERVVKALTWRISLSILLFFLLLIAYSLGWVTPHGI